VTGRRRPERGQSLVEFALVIPIIVLMIASFVEIGRAVFAYNTVANAARQGVRVAIVNQLPDVTDCDESRPIEDPYEPHWSIIGCAILAGKTLGLTAANVTVAYVTPPSTTLACSPTLHVGCIAAVTVTYQYDVSTPIVSRFIGPITMTQTSEMPVERVFP
jgi:Flp pilus assembly protein TadG